MQAELGYVSPRNEKISTAISGNDAYDRRIFVLAIADDDVAYRGDLVAPSVEYRAV